MIKDIIGKLMEKKDLTSREAEEVMEEIMSDKATDAQIAGFLVALRLKGETVEEITSFAKVMRKKATKIKVTNKEIIVDTCGTGGDCSNTFNISTATAFVVAGAGLKVAKHGNKAASSQCGSADVLQALGVNLDVIPEKVAECINRIGIGFLFAPLLHGAMKYAIGPRKELGIRTVFNILGPLTNPADANAQILGIYDKNLTETIANVLKNLGVKRAFVVAGEDDLDEITITDKTKISELNQGEVKTYHIEPEDFGLKKASLDDIKGGTIEENSKIIMNVLNGEKSSKRDIVLINAAAALIAGNKADNFKEGIKLAEDSIDSGKALEKLNMLIKVTNE